MLSGCIIVADVDADWDWNGRWVERDQSVGEVNAVHFSARGTLYITQGKHNELKLEGHKDALAQVSIEERSGTLYIESNSGIRQWYSSGHSGKEPVYRLSIRDLEELRHGGRGTLKMGPLTTENLQIESSRHANTYVASVNAKHIALTAADHGRINVETLDAETLRIQVEDHGDVYVEDGNVLDTKLRAEDHGEIWIAGNADSMQVVSSDYSNIDAEAFTVSIATINAEDFSRTKVNAAQQANLDQQDRARVDIQGDAKIFAEQE